MPFRDDKGNIIATPVSNPSTQAEEGDRPTTTTTTSKTTIASKSFTPSSQLQHQLETQSGYTPPSTPESEPAQVEEEKVTSSFITPQKSLISNLTSQLSGGSPVSDVAGNVLTPQELSQKALDAPKILTPYGQIQWARNELSPDTTVPVIQPTQAYDVWGVKPDQSQYRVEQQNLTNILNQGKESLNQLIQFKQDFPSFETKYQEYSSWYKTSLEQMKTSETSTQWGVDVDFSGNIESDEYFNKETAIEKFKQFSPDNLMVDVGGGQTKSYKQAYVDALGTYINIDKTIQDMRSSLSDITSTQTLLTGYKKAGYGLEKTDLSYQFTQLTPEEVYKKATGRSGSDVFLAKQLMTFNIPWYINIAMGRSEEYKQEEYARLLELTRRPGESIAGYSSRFWMSPEVIESVWIPLATMGYGYITTGLSAGGKIIGTGSNVATRLSSFGTTTLGKVTNVAMKGGMVIAGGVGIGLAGYQIETTAVNDPEHLGTVIGHLGSTMLLGYAGYKTGVSTFERFNPKLMKVNGKYKVDVELIRKEIQLSDTVSGQQNLGQFDIYGRAFFYGEKPGTGLETYYQIKGVGAGGKPIGEFTAVSRSSGLFYNKLGKDITGIFEAYGKSTIPTPIGDTNMLLVADKWVAGTYGQYPDVHTGGGLTWLTKSGTKTTGFSIGDGNILLKGTGTFDITSSISRGTFESNLVKGSYVEQGITSYLKSVGNKLQVVDITSGLEKFITDTKGYLSLVGREIPSTIEITGQGISNTISQSLSNIGMVSGKTTFVTPFSISSMITIPNIGIAGIPQVKTVNIQKTETMNIPKTEMLSIPRLENVSIPKLKQEIINISKFEPVTSIKLDNEVIVTPKTEEMVMPKMEQTIFPKMQEVSVAKMIDEIKLPLNTVPTVSIPIPIPIPFLPVEKVYGAGGDWGWGNYWGKRKRYREANILNPFSTGFDIDFGIPQNNVGGRGRRKKRKK